MLLVSTHPLSQPKSLNSEIWRLTHQHSDDRVCGNQPFTVGPPLVTDKHVRPSAALEGAELCTPNLQ